ncbi:hypothetical protein Vadar_015034 [Vaccinium darrowii]|uniref:Uncharacterized protein n=1 Tax=Vaccinium darrowii TaxID=229202 RepID=A0ACB7ZCN9_9ERIC|nr:hypothetical protein Vadar_015034 [Vaccinium darrowii]
MLSALTMRSSSGVSATGSTRSLYLTKIMLEFNTQGQSPMRASSSFTHHLEFAHRLGPILSNIEEYEVVFKLDLHEWTVPVQQDAIACPLWSFRCLPLKVEFAQLGFVLFLLFREIAEILKPPVSVFGPCLFKDESRFRSKFPLALRFKIFEPPGYGLDIRCDDRVMSNQEAVDFIKSIKDAESAAKHLIDEALSRKSRDDISCIVVKFQ